jgi:hypothetical protein
LQILVGSASDRLASAYTAGEHLFNTRRISIQNYGEILSQSHEQLPPETDPDGRFLDGGVFLLLPSKYLITPSGPTINCPKKLFSPRLDRELYAVDLPGDSRTS